MYPFGHGLTYSTFEYSDLKTFKAKYRRGAVVSLTFRLINTGSIQAEEVVQVYVQRINSKVEWPMKELKAFSGITLVAGGSKSVTIKIPVKSLDYWNESIGDWDYDPCEIEFLVGASAGDIKLRTSILTK
jgi:beta-glucosidase